MMDASRSTNGLASLDPRSRIKGSVGSGGNPNKASSKASSEAGRP